MEHVEVPSYSLFSQTFIFLVFVVFIHLKYISKLIKFLLVNPLQQEIQNGATTEVLLVSSTSDMMLLWKYILVCQKLFKAWPGRYTVPSLNHQSLNMPYCLNKQETIHQMYIVYAYLNPVTKPFLTPNTIWFEWPRKAHSLDGTFLKGSGSVSFSKQWCCDKHNKHDKPPWKLFIPADEQSLPPVAAFV